MDIQGKGALITGASGGIGGAIARILHQAGARVYLSGRNIDALAQISAELPGSSVITADLEDPTSVHALIPHIEVNGGTVDILVNNGGLTRDQLSFRMDDEAWHKVIQVNLTAAFQLSKDALKGMIKRKWGRIVNISSIVGITGNPGQANYVASKAGLIGLTKTLSLEVARWGITVNTVAPGYIETAMTQQLPEVERGKMIAGVPMGRVGKPEDVARSVLFLVRDADYTTGHTLHVSGGWALG